MVKSTQYYIYTLSTLQNVLAFHLKHFTYFRCHFHDSFNRGKGVSSITPLDDKIMRLSENTSSLISHWKHMSTQGLMNSWHVDYSNTRFIIALICFFELYTFCQQQFFYLDICICVQSAIQIFKLIMPIVISIKLISHYELSALTIRLSINLIYLFILFRLPSSSFGIVNHLWISFVPHFRQLKIIFDSVLYTMQCIFMSHEHVTQPTNRNGNTFVNSIVFTRLE